MSDLDPMPASLFVGHGPMLAVGVFLGLLAFIPLLLATIPVLRRARDARVGVGLVSVAVSFVILLAGVVAAYSFAPATLVAFVVGELIGFFVGLIGLAVTVLAKAD